MAQKHKRAMCKRDRLWVRFPLKEMKYLILLFSRSGNEVRLRYALTTLCLQNSAESGQQNRFPLPTLLCVGYSVKLKTLIDNIFFCTLKTIIYFFPTAKEGLCFSRVSCMYVIFFITSYLQNR